MAVFRVEKTRDYTVMSNYHLRDKNLTLKAKGLLSWMLSNTEDWNYTVDGIIAVMKENRDAINSALTELEDYGYLTRERIRDSRGMLKGTEYVIRERPITDFPTLDKPTQENPQQINTNKTSNNSKKNTLPTVEGQAPKKLSYKDIYDREENKVIRDALVKFVNSCRGKNYTPKVTTIEKFAKTLRENSQGNSELAMRIVDQSIDKGWKDLYPLKEKYRSEAISKKWDGSTARDKDGNEVVY